MGGTRYDPGVYRSYASTTATKTHYDYHAKAMPKGMDPKVIKVRESVKSDLNPKPTPIIVGLDVSGSMGRVVEALRKGLGTLFEQILDRDPVSDPHVLAMAIGDMDFDSAPVQATQFEADPVTIGKQVEELYLEGGGGGNHHESYLGPLYFALMRTKCDAFAEGRKGFIFTVGDEEPQDVLTKAQLKEFFGDGDGSDMSAADLIASVERDWHYFHVIVAEGSHMGYYRDQTIAAWRKLMGQRALLLTDHTKLAEVVISAIEVTVGKDAATVTKSWSGDTSLVVREAIGGLTVAGGGAGAGPVAL